MTISHSLVDDKRIESEGSNFPDAKKENSAEKSQPAFLWKDDWPTSIIV
jgi:hypothetical protein